ncbi:MAG: PD-(D/E)XK nuclease family protein, partial [Candidatus Thermoplasmatota archaeon]|nr:PD-(D/E)XK nuclease family protein [Candidatus Thermoplasmatota archaeon]
MNRINDDIHLVTETHQYVLKRNKNQKFKSVTTIVGEYFKKFDKIGVSERLTGEHPEYMHLTPAELRAKWDAITQLGTDIHDEIDQYLSNSKPPTLRRASIGINWLRQYLKAPMNKVMSEVILYSVELGIAGTVDILVEVPGTGAYEIIDWKTGKLDFESHQGETAPHHITSDLMDCHFEKYTLQLSMYRYLLEKYYGLNIQKQVIAHLGENDCRGYDTPYRKSHIEAIINDHDSYPVTQSLGSRNSSTNVKTASDCFIAT